jgi:hypothetical protein
MPEHMFMANVEIITDDGLPFNPTWHRQYGRHRSPETENGRVSSTNAPR